MEARLSILILVPGATGDLLGGPQIRGLELARVLARRHRVTVALDGEARGPEGLRVVGASRARILWEALRHDVVLAPWLPPFLLPVLAASGAIVVADLYDPIENEIATADGDVDSELASVRRLTDLQLRFATIVACGGVRQRDHLVERAREVRGSRQRLTTVVVPFGLPPPPPPPAGHPLRESLSLDTSDFVVLWWGALWRWLDPETVIRAMALLRDRNPEIKLVFSAGPPPHPASRSLVKTEEARLLAESLNVLDETVFFMKAWIPYSERHTYIGDADLGVTLHRTGEEARRAARARYLDYLWGSLPCVLSGGDEFAELLIERKFATWVPAEDVEATAQSIEAARHPALSATARKGGEDLAEQYRWASVAEPLDGAIRVALAGGRRSRALALKALPPVLAFYLLRLWNMARSRLGRRTGFSSRVH